MFLASVSTWWPLITDCILTRKASKHLPALQPLHPCFTHTQLPFLICVIYTWILWRSQPLIGEFIPSPDVDRRSHCQRISWFFKAQVTSAKVGKKCWRRITGGGRYLKYWKVGKIKKLRPLPSSLVHWQSLRTLQRQLNIPDKKWAKEQQQKERYQDLKRD